ncbi:MAG: class I SAM-dependent methyltransferase [Candidatus Hodarchaeales archaeon]|jgi:ubiquinone/menaquinone biosynthesis C-methylase UbiE
MKRNYDFSVKDVSEAYDGPVGLLWELLMGDHIHVGGENETKRLAEKAGVSENTFLLDICSALGGPARFLARNYKARIVGLDITETMLKKARERTIKAGLTHLIEFRHGSALDIPANANMFDIVWGQDAWCYVTSKPRLISEAVRVCKPGGKIAFTDWILGTTPMNDEESDYLHTFMVFPNMETLDGYRTLLEKSNCRILEVEDLQEDFENHISQYLDMVQDLKDEIVKKFGEELYKAAESGVHAWSKASAEGKVSRGLWLAEKEK